MLIITTIVLILALIFGKITVKEIKEHVRKYRKGNGTGSTGGNCRGYNGSGE